MFGMDGRGKFFAKGWPPANFEPGSWQNNGFSFKWVSVCIDMSDHKPVIYVASKARRAEIDMWKALRGAGMNIQADWIDPINRGGEASPDAWSRHWEKCVEQAGRANHAVLPGGRHPMRIPDRDRQRPTGRKAGLDRQRLRMVYCPPSALPGVQVDRRCRQFACGHGSRNEGESGVIELAQSIVGNC